MENLQNRLPSIHDLEPLESGGTEARRGLDYQDDVAATFCLDMILAKDLKEVHCETHDDITLIWQAKEGEKVEFVQVKKLDKDQLWSISILCKRENGSGTSILEKSLSRERCAETCIFRIVTDDRVKKELEVLRYDRLDSRRNINSRGFQKLCEKVSKRVGDFKSAKGNDCEHWLKQVFWDVKESRQAVKEHNMILTLSVAKEMSHYLFSDQLEEIYNKLLQKVHNVAAPEKQASIEEKILKRDDLYQWLKKAIELQSSPSAIGSDALKKKMNNAKIPEASVSMAVEQRRRYREERLSPKYLSLLDMEKVEGDIAAKLHQTLAGLDAGEINESGVQFHSRCLNIIQGLHDSLSRTIQAPLYFFQGYMYDLTNRCLHRYAREVL